MIELAPLYILDDRAIGLKLLVGLDVIQHGVVKRPTDDATAYLRALVVRKLHPVV
tara:strand:- start:2620 stop:2784 length:165 start_codon:yes stop_codon:yes gene_type:complete